MSLQNEISLLVSSDATQGATNKTSDGAYFEISLGTDGLKIPNNAYNTTLSVEESTIWWTVPNIITGSNDLLRVIGPRASDGVTTTYNLVIPQGLYDLSGLNQAIQRELQNSSAKRDPSVLFSLSPDEPTGKAELRFNYDNVSIDFTQPNSLREISGFNSQILGPYATVPFNRLADNTARFNSVNYFVIHSDLTQTGIRFNNSYNQAVSKVVIDVPPGSQIVSTPYNPPKISCNELVGGNKTLIRMWLTDDQNRRVNTNSESWSCRLVIRYQMPYYLGNSNSRR